MSRLTRVAALASALAALGTTAYGGSAAISSFPILCAVAAVAGGVLAVVSTRAALFCCLLPAYVSPAVFLLLAGHDAYPYVAIWLAPLLGTIAATNPTSGWSVPSRWRWAIGTWALLVAVSWPLVAWRELDFTWPLVWDERLPVGGAKISGPAAVGWTAYVAHSHLIGLLWIDWLFRRYSSSSALASIRREILTPLAASIAIACAVGMYQGFVDVSFLSGHVWPSIRRASGTLMDANVFGMLAALWAPAFLLLGVRATPAGSIAAIAGFAAACAGVWTSGSRTALLAALVGTVWAAVDLSRRLGTPHARRLWMAGVATAVLLLGALFAFAPSASTNAIARARRIMPSVSWSSLRQTAWILWVRDGYGTAATSAIVEHPLAGVGVGAFQTLSSDYVHEAKAIRVRPDNAQNWFRHQLAELGIIGSLPWIAFAFVLAGVLYRDRPRVGAAVALRGPITAFALASLLGMAAQHPSVVLTFWLLLYWYTVDTGAASGEPRPTSRLAWAATVVMVAVVMTDVAARERLRPPFRAARFDFDYTYGFYLDRDVTWSAGYGVTVPRATKPWMKLTCWVNHPDANERPVRAEVWRDGEQVVDRLLLRGDRIVQFVPTPGENKRFVLEVNVDRTWRPSDYGEQDSRELGLAMQWEFVDNPPH